MFKSRARKFADMFSTSLKDVLEGGELDKTAVGGLTDVEAKADANAATVSALHTVATTGDYNDLSNKPAADITEVTAGGGLTGGGTSGAVTINHQDTSSQGSVNNSGNTVIQDITLDTYGHITAIGSTTISSSPPTTFGAVGTYCKAVYYGGAKSPGSTIAGSAIRPGTLYKTGNFTYRFGSTLGMGSTEPTLSGTWRIMSGSNISNSTKTYYILVVRIS